SQSASPTYFDLAANGDSVYRVGADQDFDINPPYSEWTAANYDDATGGWFKYVIPFPPSTSYPTGGNAVASAVAPAPGGLFVGGSSNVYDQGPTDEVGWAVARLDPATGATTWIKTDIVSASDNFSEAGVTALAADAASVYAVGLTATGPSGSFVYDMLLEK